MLIPGSVPGHVKVAQLLGSNCGREDHLFDGMHGTDTWQKSHKCGVLPHSYFRKARRNLDVKETANSIYSNLLNDSGLSAICDMSDSCRHNLVYRRRKLQKNSVTESHQVSADKRNSVQCLPAQNSGHNLVVERNSCKYSEVAHETEYVAVPLASPLPNLDPLTYNSECIDGYLGGEGQTLRACTDKSSGLPSLNDSCSSSVSVMQHGSNSMKIEVDNTGECSSSGDLMGEFRRDDMPERDVCICLLRSIGLLKNLGMISPDLSGSSDDHLSGSASHLCKVCGYSDIARNMLICDHCDEPYHIFCCNPRVKSIPVDEWLCHPCFKKKHKLLQEMTLREADNVAIHKSGAFGSGASRIAFMLADTEPYTTGVRIGRSFQAEVSEWSGPIKNECDSFGEPQELSPSNIFNSWNHRHVPMLNSIGNWLQCQEVIKGAGDGLPVTICGKWRRAPLFEVQTDKWDCFSSVFWDPSHADCAAPQELETNEVLKQLKYVELVRPRLAVKRRTLGCNGGTDAVGFWKRTREADHSIA